MEKAKKIILMAENLRKSDKVNSFDNNNEREADRIANSIVDMEESFKTINELTPKLLSEELSEEKINDILLDIGEELRHILYHIKDAKFYGYLE